MLNESPIKTYTFANNIQANIAKAAKAGKTPKHWSLYLFFRVLPNIENSNLVYFFIEDLLNWTQKNIENSSEEKDKNNFTVGNNFLENNKDLLSLENFPNLLGYVSNPKLYSVPDTISRKSKSPDAKPNTYFFAWLKRVLGESSSVNSNDSGEDFKEIFRHQLELNFKHRDMKWVSEKTEETYETQSKNDHDGLSEANLTLLKLAHYFIDLFESEELHDYIVGVLNDTDAFQPSTNQSPSSLFNFQKFDEDDDEESYDDDDDDAKKPTEAEHAIKNGLLTTLAYDFVRQFNKPQKTDSPKGVISPDNTQGLIRSEEQQSKLDYQKEEIQSSKDELLAKPLPINIGFTFPGLKALKINESYLNTFPDVFQDGMAARAAIIADTGPSAPAHWDGELGSRAIHGMINTGFHAPNVKLKHWSALRKQVEQYNRNGKKDQNLRFGIILLFRLLGIEILHIELGETPSKNTNPKEFPLYPDYRVEHFGFRDGVSQPFIDMGLGTPSSGGGDPSRNNSWEPIAPGEIYLGMDDEDGQRVNQPACKSLRDHGTYLVFRKLEQDVGGFREYLRKSYPSNPQRQKRLSAQMVGRWPNGTSLVQAPNEELALPEGELNNFRYNQEDTNGLNCPLGAHIRRANPRDIGGRGTVKRHRILRRSMSYGGPFLPEGSIDKTERRGMLFVAMNSRIDLQFELIQSRWLNSGEFLGQVGLNKCPLTGANSGKSTDKFYESKALSPVRELPRFVTTKGGDYFFIPSLTALKAIAKKEFETTSKHPLDNVLDNGFTTIDAKTPSIFSEEKIKELAGRLLQPKTGGLLVKPSEFDRPSTKEPMSLNESGADILFVGQHADVVNVLRGHSSTDSKPNFRFSTKRYLDAGKSLLRGDKVILGTDLHSPVTHDDRKLMVKILSSGWIRLNRGLEAEWKRKYPKAPYSIHQVIKAIVTDRSNKALRRVAPSGQIDLVQDLATDTAYSIIVKLFGMEGPDWLTELAIALPFSKTNVGGLHPDWLETLSGKKPSRSDVATMQVWSITSFVALIADLQMRREVSNLARKAGSELTDHIDRLVLQARESQSLKGENLLECFILNQRAGMFNNISSEDYYRYVRSLLAELIVSTLTLLPATFGSLMENSLKNNINLSVLIPKLKKYNDDRREEKLPNAIYKFIYEMNRTNPSLPLLMRYCEMNTDINNIPVMKGQWVAALVAAANFDPRAFPEPRQFSLDPVFPGPKRDIRNYLMFGGNSVKDGKSEHSCWGRDTIVLSALENLLIAASKLQGLKSVAGPDGEPAKLLGVTVGLPAKFSAFDY